MENENRKQEKKEAPNISRMEPVTHGAYGGGLYGTEKGQPEKPVKPSASDTQSADAPVESTTLPKHPPPPSSGDRDIDITGQSYIQ
ncbi:Transcription activator-like protein [Quillaja saponaria]|uniref:Transcription activator-like protein n=1 Tax=Quillaja saponaria TaxID=32244 RepID=A0AAD7LZ90_QUISA|nr:Transcription activator-like protein [Quillaja saponaria]